MAEMTVRVEGTVTTTSTTAAPSAVSITQGGQTANIAVPGPNLGAGLVTTTGSLVAASTLVAIAGAGPGTTVDFGSGKARITIAILAGAGVSAGAVALEVSQDSVNWFQNAPTTLTAPGVTSATVIGAWRYARGNVTTAITGGAVGATLMSS